MNPADNYTPAVPQVGQKYFINTPYGFLLGIPAVDTNHDKSWDSLGARQDCRFAQRFDTPGAAEAYAKENLIDDFTILTNWGPVDQPITFDNVRLG